jgi:hypothetical protein
VLWCRGVKEPCGGRGARKVGTGRVVGAAGAVEAVAVGEAVGAAVGAAVL